MHIRRFHLGEEAELFNVYHSAIHLIACRDYTQDQVNAWAPSDLSQTLWTEKMRSINPFVAEIGGEVVGYADLQLSGYIDHFFVSGKHTRQGIGANLMGILHQEAYRLGVDEMTSDVSLTAQPFFEKFGFNIVERRLRELRGVIIPNAFMRRELV